MNKLFSYILVFIIAIALMGCSQAQPKPNFKNAEVDLVYVSYNMVNKLENNLKAPISPEEPIIVASFVDVNNLQQSSTFGRIMAEQVGSRFAQKGYKVIEMKLRQKSIFVEKGKGEFLLSRDIKDISQDHNASAVIVGTYGSSSDKIYISLRIIDPKDSTILASYDYGIPAGRRLQKMLINE